MRKDDEQYFEGLESALEEALSIANEARRRGGDPTAEVEIPIARDMADRVENILGIDGVAERVREMEADPDLSREEAALELASDFADGSVGDYETRAGKVEGAIRTAVALLTEGVVAAPIEGIDRVELLENDDGTEFVNVYYAGPIRSAGGTAQALSVLVADYTRTLIGVEGYNARRDEVERYAEELSLYDDETGLQYAPKDKEAKFIAKHLPVMLDGEATGDEEVSGFRDLERVDTNNARGGMCLVLGEGIAQKAPKIQRYTSQLDEVEWPWLQDLIDGNYGGDGDEGESDNGGSGGDTGGSDGDTGGSETGVGAEVSGPGAADDAGDSDTVGGADGPPRTEPTTKFLRDLIAGRPVFGHPSEEGGFRLRYGRARNHGFATAGVHPATMHLVDDFLAAGTQIKTEHPGKAAGVVPVDSMEGPTVRLANGDVRRIDDPEEALEVRNGVEAILDLGEYLVNYGEFVENNHPLSPAGYAPEWWKGDLAAAGADVQALEDSPRVDLEHPDAEQALRWVEEYDAPLHPEYTYLWHDLDIGRFEALVDAASNGGWAEADGAAVEQPSAGLERTLVVENTEPVRGALEVLLVEHEQGPETLTIPDAVPLVRSLGLTDDLERTWRELSAAARQWDGGENAMKAVDEVAPFELRERAPTRIGCRMGRPEKSEKRDLSPAVHTLFPIGETGGPQRSVADAAKHAETMQDAPGKFEAQVGRRRCPSCSNSTFRARCPDCNAVTEPHYVCYNCDIDVEPDEAGRAICPNCESEADAVQRTVLDINEEYRSALSNVSERENAFDVLKGVQGLSSKHKVPEPIEKGILRAKNGVSSFKDGTVRYDMTDLPVTSVRASELDVTVGQLKSLGYEEDVHGQPLTHEDQLVELRVQDVVLSDGAAEHMMRTADFVDDLLGQYYGMDRYYELETRDDLVGELVFGMAPHTSAAVVGRVIGFTSAAVGYAHPYFHAAKRRNCFHPKTKLWYEDETGWHHEEIEGFVESRLDDPETDDFGTLVQEMDSDVYVPSVTDEGEAVNRRVTDVSKHVAPEHMVELETAGGRTLRVTPDHTMLRFDGGVGRVSASEIEPGDTLPADFDEEGTSGKTGSIPNSVRSDQISLDSIQGKRRTVQADGGIETDTVVSVEYKKSNVTNTYCLTVEETNAIWANGVYTGQCDGDEDCVMLLMDGILNFSKTFLPDQRGGSVTEDSRLVAVGPDDEIEFLTFDEFWDELETPVHHDGKFEKKLIEDSGWRTYVFDEKHRSGLKPIERAIRYEADDEGTLLQISTQFGRSLEITEHHSLFRYENGIEEVAGGELGAGDLILAPREFDVEEVERTIDVVNCLDEPYVIIDEHIEDLLRTAWESTDRGSPTHETFYNGLSHRLSKDKIPFERLSRILDEGGFVVPENVEIALWGAMDGIQRKISIDEEFAWLLGMFVAEGSLSGVNPTLFNSDEGIIDRVVSATEASLGIEPTVKWSNKSYRVTFPSVFREVLYELGFENRGSYSSSEKVIPDSILRAPKETALAFIRGFVSGDGSEPSDDNYTSIQFHTTSDQVKDGVVFLLHRFGLVANVSRRERDESRQPIFDVSVSGGVSDNPLRRILEDDDPYHPKSLVVGIPDALMEIREMEIRGIKQLIPKYLKRRENVSLEKLGEMVSEIDGLDLPPQAERKLDEIRPLVDGDLSYLRITDVEEIDYDGMLYDLQVGGEPIFTANWLYAHNSMDAPLVMSSRIDPAEIDDEAHNMDIASEYPREFYEATREMADPGEVEELVQIGEDTLGTDDQYRGFEHTHDTVDIAAGPDLSAYKTLGDMMEKMNAQLELSRKLRAVDETDVAERVIEYHFLPDIIGNLRAFSRQETRCLDCGEKFRRVPLTGECRECGGRVNLTVHEGSVKKYIDTAIQVADEYGCREYTKQRLKILDRAVESVFEDDTNKQSGIADFM